MSKYASGPAVNGWKPGDTVHDHSPQVKGTGAEMHPALVSGIVSRDSLVSYWSIFVVSSQVTDPEVFAKV